MMSVPCYNAEIVVSNTLQVLKDCVALVEHSKRKTVTVNDVGSICYNCWLRVKADNAMLGHLGIASSRKTYLWF